MGMTALIVDDHELFRSGLKQLLVDYFDVDQLFEADTLDAALEVLTNEGAGELVLVDLNMPGMSGAEGIAALWDGFPDTRIAVVSASEDRGDILAALSAGAHGYIPKSLSASEIAEAIRDILEGRIVVPASVGRRHPSSQPRSAPLAGDKLTARQREVLRELMKGQSSKVIARALDITEGTVKIHLAAIYRAIGVRSRAEAIAMLKSNESPPI